MHPMPRFRSLVHVIAAATLVTLAAVHASAAERFLPGDAFLCAEARPVRAARGAPPLPTFHPRVGVSVVDRFTRPVPSDRYTLDLRKPEVFCRPVRLDGEEVTNALSGLEAYAARRTRRKPAPPPLPVVSETVDTSFGTVPLRVGNVLALQVPTLATGSVGGGGPDRDHFACYDVRVGRGADVHRGVLHVEVRTADGRRTVEVRKPDRLCVPASVRGADAGAPKHPLDLLCFDARLARTAAAAGPADVLATRNAFGNEVLKLGAPRLLCVPAARSDVVVPTVTPFPTLTPLPTLTSTPTPVPTPRVPTVRIDPTGATALVRDHVCFAAWLDLPDGTSVDVSATADWRIADDLIAAPAGVTAGRKCFFGVGIGTTTVTARDVALGVASPPARLEYEWPIYELEVAPRRLGLRPGESQTLTVIASFTGNRTRNVTQHVRYDSGNDAIVRAPNASRNRSRIEAVGMGTTSVVVRDTLSSITDFAEVAVGDLQAIRVEEVALLFPGDATHLQATGLFTGGFTSNLTQVVAYESSDPAVVLAPNLPGERNRVEALAPGVSIVTAVDPLSGIRSTCCGRVSVLGDLRSLTMSPNVRRHRKGIGGDPLTLEVVGRFAIPPHDSASVTVTERVTWSVESPGVVALAGIADGRQRLDAVGGGVAVVLATDDVTGLQDRATVTIYDRLDRVDVGTDRLDPAEALERTIRVGAAAGYVAHGWFDGARYARLDDARFVADPPGVVELVNGFAYGRRAGTVTLGAVDVPSGLSSATGGRNVLLHVVGGIERLVLSPATATLEVGLSRTLTATGYDDVGNPTNVTQRVRYESSDPSIVVATNDPGNASRILAAGAGTATISAFDPETGATTMGGGAAVVTVFDDTLVRIVVSPLSRRVAASSRSRFVATAQYADGDVRNFTQRVEWRSNDASVAVAPNVAGDRSRIDALAPGVATISAYDAASGLTSSDTGDDAVLTVEALAALELSPPMVELRVGAAFSLTTIGIVDGGVPINVTQDAAYVSSDPGIVRATNESGNKSRIEGVAPGIATVTAIRTSAFPQATESNTISVTVLP